MTIEITEKTYTVPEFLDLEFPEDDDNEYELIGGIIMARPKSGVSAEHGKIVSRLDFICKATLGLAQVQKSWARPLRGHHVLWDESKVRIMLCWMSVLS